MGKQGRRALHLHLASNLLTDEWRTWVLCFAKVVPLVSTLRTNNVSSFLTWSGLWKNWDKVCIFLPSLAVEKISKSTTSFFAPESFKALPQWALRKGMQEGKAFNIVALCRMTHSSNARGRWEEDFQSFPPPANFFYPLLSHCRTIHARLIFTPSFFFSPLPAVLGMF